eukprot:CAMPEP_0118949764 /NCGR_PEP_ID=MMETSP1169-20130426/50209_1 /TAXON_ID=36882 /ORGANISM="Pyramimonas obovata, Strain CCMP722" /LENGTH=99 /DNA_ID=CAMNT_0006896457 /DNA_START=58 /DNA_END=354 /DNA_ORIENTATION=+
MRHQECAGDSPASSASDPPSTCATDGGEVTLGTACGAGTGMTHRFTHTFRSNPACRDSQIWGHTWESLPRQEERPVDVLQDITRSPTSTEQLRAPPNTP